MKKSLIYISVILAALTLGSCSDFLDKTPSTALTTSEAIETLDDAYATLIGVYDAVQGNSDNLGWYGARMVYYADVRGDLMQSDPDGSRTQNLYDMNYTADSNLPNMWTVPYDAIRRASNLIKAIDAGQVKTTSEAEEAALQDMRAQAVVIRALAHYDLCKVYGKHYLQDNSALGVPIIDFVADPTYKPERNTVKEVYDFVVEEIEGCKAALSTDAEYGFINYYVAEALLSRIYLDMGENEKVLTAVKAVLNNGGQYRLMTNDEYADGWGQQGNPEFVWEIVSNGSDDWVDREGVPYLVWESGYADYILTSKAVKMFEERPNDVRVYSTRPAERDDRPYKNRYGEDWVFCAKYPGAGFYSDTRYNNIYGVRLAETILNGAEAAFKLYDANKSHAAELKEYYEDIVMRADPTRGAVDVSKLTIDSILNERGLELIGEGFRYFDLARNNKTIDRTDRYTHIFSDPQAEAYTRDWYKAILAIPLAEMNANSNMVQNPGY